MRCVGAGTALVSLLLLAGSADALPVSDPTYLERFEVSFEGMAVGTFRARR